jgi:tRNA(His) guanylyltransferase
MPGDSEDMTLGPVGSRTGGAVEPWRRWGLPEPKSEASRGALSLVDYEVYSGIEVHDWPFFVRLDGWAFHGLTRRLKLRKPFDRRLAVALALCARTFFVPFNPALCYIFSDELNFLFLKPNVFRRVEKIDSVFAGLLSARFHVLTNTPCAFDCRVIPVGEKNVLRYLVWRQSECARNHNNAWAQWVMTKKEGLRPRDANEKLEGLKARQLFGVCRKHGVDLGGTPAWQRRGVLLYNERYGKRGYNPLTKKRVTTKRRRVVIDWKPPVFASREGKALVKSILAGQSSAS